MFDRSKARGDGSVVPAWPDSTYVRRVGVPQEKLRSGLETIGGDPCLGEHVTFDIGGHALGIPLRY